MISNIINHVVEAANEDVVVAMVVVKEEGVIIETPKIIIEVKLVLEVVNGVEE